MKRIKAACICQTLHFMLKDGVENDFAVKMVKEEVAGYKKKLELNRTQYKILEETQQSDGSTSSRSSSSTTPPPWGII